jgi:hypothetical protein
MVLLYFYCFITSILYGFKWKKVEHNDLEDEEWREVIINNKTEDYFVSSLGRFKKRSTY